MSFISNVRSSCEGGTVTRKRKQEGTMIAEQLSAPTCVSDYNNMEPIDRSDQMRQAYGMTANLGDGGCDSSCFS